MKRKFAMTLSYDGRAYRGWQRQKNTKNTIQGQISPVIERAFEQSIDLQGASRTDTWSMPWGGYIIIVTSKQKLLFTRV